MKKSFVLTILAAFVAVSSSTTEAAPCNGYEELCSKRFSEVCFATTHNAYAFGSSIAANQVNDIPTQLKDGVRGFMLDIHSANNTNGVQLCHGQCRMCFY